MGPSREAQCIPARVHTKEFTTMALSQSALNDLLDALRAGGDLDVVREALAPVLQALIDAGGPTQGLTSTDLRQIATASSSNATARRRLTGSSMASS